MPKLTKRDVDRFKSEQADVFKWDSEVRGFGLRVKPSGQKSYFVQYRNERNKSRRLTIGPHGVYTPEAARDRARELLRQARAGGDPAQERKEARSAPEEPTIADLAERYLAAHAKTKKRPSSVRMDALNLKLHVLPAFGRARVSEVARSDITRFHHEMRNTPGAANRTLALLSKMFNLAEQWGWRQDGTNPCRHVERYPERKMERYLSSEELARLGATLARAEREGTEMPAAIAAIRLLVFTWARLGEILTLKWTNVDFERRSLMLDTSKTGRKTIHLNASALAVLAAIERSEGSPWVIVGAIAGRPLINLRKPWYRIRRAAGLDGVRLHDLRHSFAAAGAASGLSLPMIGALLGHTQPVTTQRYGHLAASPLKQAADLIGQRLAGAMADGIAADVVPLQRARG